MELVPTPYTTTKLAREVRVCDCGPTAAAFNSIISECCTVQVPLKGVARSSVTSHATSWVCPRSGF